MTSYKMIIGCLAVSLSFVACVKEYDSSNSIKEASATHKEPSGFSVSGMTNVSLQPLSLRTNMTPSSSTGEDIVTVKVPTKDGGKITNLLVKSGQSYIFKAETDSGYYACPIIYSESTAEEMTFNQLTDGECHLISGKSDSTIKSFLANLKSKPSKKEQGRKDLIQNKIATMRFKDQLARRVHKKEPRDTQKPTTTGNNQRPISMEKPTEQEMGYCALAAENPDTLPRGVFHWRIQNSSHPDRSTTLESLLARYGSRRRIGLERIKFPYEEHLSYCYPEAGADAIKYLVCSDDGKVESTTLAHCERNKCDENSGICLMDVSEEGDAATIDDEEDIPSFEGEPIEGTCVDSDVDAAHPDGINPEVYGYAQTEIITGSGSISYGFSLADSCDWGSSFYEPSTGVTEAYCDGDVPAWTTIPCPEGTFCRRGGPDESINLCMPPPSTATCTDTDKNEAHPDGKNFEQNGCTYFVGTDGWERLLCDYCSFEGPEAVAEMVCADGTIGAMTTVSLECASGEECRYADGRPQCLPIPPVPDISCTDSDAETDHPLGSHFVPGTATATGADVEPMFREATDACPSTIMLLEAECAVGTGAVDRPVFCPDGTYCADHGEGGRCIPLISECGCAAISTGLPLEYQGKFGAGPCKTHHDYCDFESGKPVVKHLGCQNGFVKIVDAEICRSKCNNGVCE